MRNFLILFAFAKMETSYCFFFNGNILKFIIEFAIIHRRLIKNNFHCIKNFFSRTNHQ